MINLEKIYELILNNPGNINIQYLNINGKEKLLINGKEVEDEKCSFDDSKVKEYIRIYKNNIDELDDCIFVDTMEEVGEYIDLKELDSLINKEHLTESEANSIYRYIDYIYSVIVRRVEKKIQSLTNLLKRF